MKKVGVILAVILIVLVFSWSFRKKSEAPTIQVPSLESSAKLKQTPLVKESSKEIIVSNIPLSSPEKRITKKPFGILISPKNSPIPSERFSGYHTGTDFETFSEEANADVEVRAICEGKIIQKKRVSGYGGVIIQSCILNGERVTILYGHLKLSDSPVEIGKTFFRGDKLAILGSGESTDTDGERKHLHLGIKKDDQIDVRGYVSNKNELVNWLDSKKILFLPIL